LRLQQRFVREALDPVDPVLSGTIVSLQAKFVGHI
jgi:hypothetical protein